MIPSKEKINFIIREMEETDIKNRFFFQTLSNLTEVGKIQSNYKRARKIFREIRSYPFHKIFVAVKDNGEIIGSTTLLIEQKFVHNGGRVGHIEDVATRKEYQGIGVGSALIRRSIEFAKRKQCYKVILDCSDKNIPFYEKLGFKRYEISMRCDLQ
jgi:glucosamine-phosphate N-acetyltransferase